MNTAMKELARESEERDRGDEPTAERTKQSAMRNLEQSIEMYQKSIEVSAPALPLLLVLAPHLSP